MSTFNLKRDGIVIAAAKRLKNKLSKDGFSDQEAIRVLQYVLAEFNEQPPATESVPSTEPEPA